MYSAKSYPKVLGLFFVHQLVGTWGIAIFAYYSGTSFLELIGRPQWIRTLQWILTETPFFPIQVILGLGLGWSLARRLAHRSMLWVWVIPTLILIYATV